MNSMRAALVSAVWLSGVIFFGAVGVAEDKGQADLNKATELQLGAETLADFENVADLCEQALSKGLGDENKKFAHELLASALLEHARRLAAAILEQPTPNPRWPAIRNNAVRDLDRLLKHQPNTGEAHLLRARLLLLPGGDPAEARKAVDFAVKEFQKDDDEKENLAKALLLRSRLVEEPAARLADIEAALKADPESVEAWQARAGHYLATGETEKGIADLRRLVEQHGDLLAARLALVQALAKLDKFDDALKQLDEIERIRDDIPTTHQLRAQIFVQQKKLDAAIEALDMAVKLDARGLGLLFMRAQVQTQREAWPEALADLDRILKIQPGQPQAILLRSSIFAEQKKFGEAIKEMNELIRQEKENLSLRIQAASLYVAGGWPRTAIRHLNVMLQEDPGNWLALRTRADAYLNIGKHAEAIADFKRASEAQPNNSGILNNLAWVLATSPEDKLRDAKRSIELGKTACEVTDYKLPHILSTLAAGYAEDGDFEMALKWSAKAVELAENDENKEQLGKELASYKNKKPWREKQEHEEKANPPVLVGDKDQL